MPQRKSCKNDLVFSALDRYRPTEKLAAISTMMTASVQH